MFFDQVSGTAKLSSSFFVILPRVRLFITCARKGAKWLADFQGTVVTETNEYRKSFQRVYQKKDEIPANRSIRIVKYRGLKEEGIWMDEEPGKRIFIASLTLAASPMG